MRNSLHKIHGYNVHRNNTVSNGATSTMTSIDNDMYSITIYLSGF